MTAAPIHEITPRPATIAAAVMTALISLTDD